MDLQTLIIAMSIPSGVTAFCFWMIEQKIKKQQTEAEEKEKIQNLLKTAGVDLTTPLPVTVTLHKFAEKLQELKTLLGK